MAILERFGCGKWRALDLQGTLSDLTHLDILEGEGLQWNCGGAERGFAGDLQGLLSLFLCLFICRHPEKIPVFL
jgi:hypothetical protein